LRKRKILALFSFNWPQVLTFDGSGRRSNTAVCSKARRPPSSCRFCRPTHGGQQNSLDEFPCGRLRALHPTSSRAQWNEGAKMRVGREEVPKDCGLVAGGKWIRTSRTRCDESGFRPSGNWFRPSEIAPIIFVRHSLSDARIPTTKPRFVVGARAVIRSFVTVIDRRTAGACYPPKRPLGIAQIPGRRPT
jgi:hypothetical protein